MIGAGGHARVCLEALLADPDNVVVGALSRDGTGIDRLGIPVLGLDADLRDITESRSITTICVAIGHNEIRRTFGQMLRSRHLDLVKVVAPSAVVSSSAVLADGVQLLPAAVVNAATTIGEGSIVNTNASVDHDCRVGEYVHVAPGVAIGGDVSIGDGAFVGIGARVLPGRSVGAGAIVGAGAVVVRDVAPGTTVVGVPARVLAAGGGTR